MGATWSFGRDRARIHRDGGAVNRVWWHSPGHHKNMLGSHKRVGVGRSGKLWTEMFGG